MQEDERPADANLCAYGAPEHDAYRIGMFGLRYPCQQANLWNFCS